MRDENVGEDPHVNPTETTQETAPSETQASTVAGDGNFFQY